MAWTQSDVDALKGAIKSGIRRVTYTDKTVEYQDTASMLRTLKVMEAEVASDTERSSTSRTVLVQHARGV